MTATICETDRLAAFRARNELIRGVRALLKGTGLENREREKELVIYHPSHPEKGRIYINFATGEVSLREVIWDYWGYLEGHGCALWADPDSEPAVKAGRIISTLGGQMGNS